MTTNINSNGHKTERIPEGRPLLKDISNLTPRVYETLGLLAQGYSNPEIAELMAVRLKSVENYVNMIYEHLGLRGNGAARVLASKFFYGQEPLDSVALAYITAARKVKLLQGQLQEARQRLDVARRNLDEYLSDTNTPRDRP